MASLVFRLGVLLLALLLQAGSWRAEASASADIVAAEPISMGDFDAADDVSEEELAGVDDSSGADVVTSSVPHWCSAASSGLWQAWADGSPPGGPALDAPFKPPRS
jgi:hypothetical protein